jgi:hypothetical protein
MEQKRQTFYWIKWKFALLAIVFFAALISGGVHAYGRQLSGSNNSPRPGLHQSQQAYAANFCLSPFRTDTDGMNGEGSASIVFCPQQQPFVEAPVQVRLLNDDPKYIKKSSPWAIALKVFTSNVFTWAMNRFIFNYSWSHIGPKTWTHNLKTGWEWDTDKFGMNFFFHPYSGGAYFNSARTNGYGYFASVPFAFLGSFIWEYFGETTLPAYNDVLNTTLSGALFGEILYRLSSSILDDRKTGAERFFREVAAAILSPGRAFSRLLQGKLKRVTPKDIYQKEPLNITLTTGLHWFNTGTTLGELGTSGWSAILGIHLDYGDPFEIRPRKPFDFFKLRIDLSYGKNVGKKYLDNAVGYGLLFGKTVHSGNWDMLIGAFQHYNYWDSHIFEVGALGFGPGIIAKWQLSKNCDMSILWKRGSLFGIMIIPAAAKASLRALLTLRKKDK